MSKKKKTYRGVFIIESINDDEEEHDRKEGKALAAMLDLAKRARFSTGTSGPRRSQG